MSDSESVAAAPHPTLGGKSLQSIERPRYKSWRKKYRKMRSKFDVSLEDNKRMFKEEQKLECIAKRLREELDGLLDLCLDLNQTPSLPPDLRFHVQYQPPHHSAQRRKNSLPTLIPTNISPEEAHSTLQKYDAAVRSGQIPPLDLHVVREHIDEALAAQGVETLEGLEKSVPHAIAGELPNDMRWKGESGGEPPPGFLTSEQETEYLDRLDARLGGEYNLNNNAAASSTRSGREAPDVIGTNGAATAEKHWAELTPRELERQAELLNPMSQHNWLKTHTKALASTGGEGGDDNESLASHPEHAPKATSTRKRPNTTKTPSSLARQVGDRALERARDGGWSPSAASGMDEDELAFDDGGQLAGGSGGGSRKKGRDPDGTYRLKGGKSGGGGSSGKGKRKRSEVDVGGAVATAAAAAAGSGGGEKRAKVEGVLE